MYGTKPVRIVAVLAMMLLFAATAPAEEKIDETHKLKSDGEISVSNISGKVRVTGWERQEVRITGTLGDGVEKLIVEGDDGRLKVEVKYPKKSRDTGETILILKVPEKCGLDIDVVSADVEVVEFNGVVGVEAVSGNVLIDGRPEEIDIQVVSGDVEIPAVCSEISIEAVDGDIQLSGATGDLAVDVVSGDVEIVSDEVVDLELGSVSGDVLFVGALNDKGKYSISVHSGDVEFRVPGATDASFQISAFSGDLETDFSNKKIKKHQYHPGSDLSFQTGSGDAEVEISTFSGDVKVKKK